MLRHPVRVKCFYSILWFYMFFICPLKQVRGDTNPTIISAQELERKIAKLNHEDSHKKAGHTRIEDENYLGLDDEDITTYTIRLTAGEDHTVSVPFKIPNPNAISYGNPQLVTTTIVNMNDGQQLVFKPLKPGQTTISLRDEAGILKVIFNVTITATNLVSIKTDLEEVLKEIEGLTFEIRGSKILLDGEVLVPDDYGRLYALISDKQYSDHIINMTTLSQQALSIISKKIQTDINTFAPNVTTRVLNRAIFLEGSVDNVEQSRRATQIATYYLPEIKPSLQIDKDPSAMRLPTPRQLVQNLIVINPPPPKKEAKLVRVNLHFVQLANEYSATSAFRWTPGFVSDGPQINISPGSGDGSGVSQGPTITGTLTSLIPKLVTANQSGYAKVLRSGTIVVRSGQPAKLNEQVDYPFQILGQNGQVTSSSKPVGLAIAVTPSILGKSEDIEMEVQLEQTNLVAKGTNGGPPTTAVHKINTRLYIKNAESAAIGGVNSHDLGSDFNKDDPGGAQNGNSFTPLLTLLHSKSYQKKKSQFVVFITPQILDKASDGTEDLKSAFRMKVGQ